MRNVTRNNRAPANSRGVRGRAIRHFIPDDITVNGTAPQDVYRAQEPSGNPTGSRSERRISGRGGDDQSQDIYVMSDSSAIDLCEADLSDVDVVRVDGPSSPTSDRRQTDDMNFPDPVFPDDLFQFSWHGMTPPGRANLGYDFIQHIQERIRTQAMLIDRLRVFSVDVRPPVTPSTIMESLPVRRVKDMADAAALGSCPICLESYRPRMIVRVLPLCGHSVHKPCMDKWISKSYKYTCPLDNRSIEARDQSTRPSASSLQSELHVPLRRSSRMSRRLDGPS
jgi:hypothetical protein